MNYIVQTNSSLPTTGIKWFDGDDDDDDDDNDDGGEGASYL